MYITREDAIDVLYQIINSRIISEELESQLEDIASCISHEKDGLFIWGAKDEVTDLFISVREDLITDDWNKHCEQLYERYKIRGND